MPEGVIYSSDVTMVATSIPFDRILNCNVGFDARFSRRIYLAAEVVFSLSKRADLCFIKDVAIDFLNR